MKTWSIILILSLLQIGPCSTSQQEGTTANNEVTTTQEPSRRSLVRRAFRAPEWQLAYAGDTESDAAKLKEVLTDIASSGLFDKTLSVVNALETDLSTLGKMPTLFIGNAWPASGQVTDLGLAPDSTFRERALTEAGDFLHLRYIKNPWSAPDTTIVMSVIYGPEINSLREQLYALYSSDWEQMFWGNWDYQLNRNGNALLKGSFVDRGWTPDPNTELVFSADDVAHYTDVNWRVFTPDGAPPATNMTIFYKRLNGARTATFQTIATYFGAPAPLKQQTVRAYPSVERLGLRRENMEEVQFAPESGDIHLDISNQLIKTPGPELEYALIKSYRAQHGLELPPSLDFIDAGLAVLSNPACSNQYLRMATALAKHNRLFDQTELVQPDSKRWKSRYIYNISAAAVVEYLRHNHTAVRSAGFASMKSLPAYDHQAMQDWWKERTHANRVSWPLNEDFQKGMTFAHEGYRIVNGYGGGTVAPSLDSLQYLGVNSIAIVPYSFLPGPNELGNIPVAESTGGENDQAVIYSARQAHSRGWTVMMKPQIWVSGAWPGDIDFATDAEWDQFFDRYADWITHYAIMAELEGINALCIGTEMVRSTIDHPERWLEIIAVLRSVYSGRLTYAANWGEEFENLTFWDKLDVIGLNSYYPLDADVSATNAQLLSGAQAWVAKADAIAQANGKDWWLTEVGYRSVRNAWVNPHADADGRAASMECQQRCFSAMLTAAEDAAHLRGMYIWKWPSYLGRGKRRRVPGIGFTPGGKPAAAEVKSFYERQ